MWHNKEAQQEGQGGTLNVVFHGMWVFVPRPYGVEVIAPKVLGHAYRAGSWCAEQDLSCGEYYYLDGVRPNESNVTVSRDSNVILPGPLVKNYQSGVFCTWVLPRPRTFHSIRRMPIGPQWFTGPEQSRKYVEHLKELALVQVLCYALDERSSPSIRQLSRCGAELPWDKVLDERSQTVNLHIFAEEPVSMPGRWTDLLHPTLAFTDAAKLIDMDLSFQYPQTWEGPREVLGSGVAGIPTVQVLGLPERSASVSGLSPESGGFGTITLPFDGHGEVNCGGLFYPKIPQPVPPLEPIVDGGIVFVG